MKIVLNEELDARFPGLLDSVLIPATRALLGSGLVDEADRILNLGGWLKYPNLRHLLRYCGLAFAPLHQAIPPSADECSSKTSLNSNGAG